VATPGMTHLPAWERPIRLPDDVPLTHAEPPVALDGEKGTWCLPFELARDVGPGTLLKLQVFRRRNNRIAFKGIQADGPGDDGHITVRTCDGAPLQVQRGEEDGTFLITVPEKGLSAGTTVAVTLSDVRAPTIRALNKFFVLYCPDTAEDTSRIWSDHNRHWIVAACTMHVLGGAIDHLRAYAPASVNVGEPFHVLIRPEDTFSNLSSETTGDIEVSLNSRRLKARVEQVNESTCVRLQVTLSEPGVHRLSVKEVGTGRETFTNPVLCSERPPALKPLWGMIHGHTEISDGWGTLDYYFRQMRDEAGLDFAASSDHDHLTETPDWLWDVTRNVVAKWNAPGEFVVFLGYEWAKWRQNGDGDRNVYYLHDDRPMYRSDNAHFPRPPDLFRALAGETALVIPHHTGHSGNFCDWKDHDPRYERLVEIYQFRGSYECSAEAGNPVPERYDVPPVAKGYVQRALAMGWRVGFTGGGDDHCGHSGTDYPTPWRKTSYKAGLTGLLAAELTREAVYEALYSRRVFATTGPRMLLVFELDGHLMGSEVSVAEEPSLAGSRTLHIEFHGTDPVDRIEIIRNNAVVQVFAGDGLEAEVSWTDARPLAEALLPPAEFCSHPFCFYYVRVVQKDGEAAWASPIWIDPA